MSDYELLSVYHEAIGIFFTVITTLLSLIFAYLVAMFFMAHRLGVVLFWLLNMLFGVVCYAMAGALRANGVRAALLGQEILERAALPGSAIEFLNRPLFIPLNIPYAMRAFVLTATSMALIYAILHRRAMRSAASEQAPIQP